jgi:hypothetical protein
VKTDLVLLNELGFERAATYCKPPGKKLKCEREAKWKGSKTKAGEKVYCFTVRNKVRYVGEIIQPARMFQYHYNNVMKEVREGLQKATGKNGDKVAVWVFQDFGKRKLTLAKKSLKIGRLGLEGLLIDNFQPLWNSKKGKLANGLLVQLSAKSNLTSPVPRPADKP